MNPVGFALKRPHLVFALTIVVITVGLIAYAQIPKDLLPLFKTPAVQVLTLYPGMPAEVIEKDITSRLERWTGQANGIARQESRSMVGVSIVKNYFRPDIDPNTAMSQVTALAASDLYYLPPGTIPPMVMPFDPTATVPLVLLAISSDEHDEKKLYDIAYFDLRNRLQGISGVIAPAVYGGKLRRILTYVDPTKLRALNLSPVDIAQTLRQFNTLIPTGNIKIGDQDYQIVSNGLVNDVSEIDSFPVRSSFNGREVLISDVAKTEDSAQIQSNVVRVNGKRQVYIPVYRQPGANTIAVVDAIRGSIKDILERLPQGIKIDLVGDQSEYVRSALRSLSQEGLAGALLVIITVWVFLGKFRSALFASLAIPISVLAAFACLLITGDSLNAMTLGGLALAMGRLVDDSIVVTENIERLRAEGKDAEDASLSGTKQVIAPVFAATITTIVVFVPVFFLSGISQFLFAPLARSVAFSIAASFLVAMFVIPVLMRIAGSSEHAKATLSERVFTWIQGGYRWSLHYALCGRWIVLLLSLVAAGAATTLVPALGTDLFPVQDVSHLTVKTRFASGTRIEITEQRVKEVEDLIKAAIPKNEIKTMVSNIGVLYDWPAAYTPNSGPHDAFIEVQLFPTHKKGTEEYADELRHALLEKLPNLESIVDTSTIMTAALTFGLPAPINVQISGNDLATARNTAAAILEELRGVEGVVDLRIQQRLDYPQLTVDVNRRKAAQLGLSMVDVVKNVVTATNSSISFDPSFWIDPKNGNHYFSGAQFREKDLVDENTLREIPITSKVQDRIIPLKEVATFGRQFAPTEINHLNISRVVDIYANVSGKDLGSVTREVERRVQEIEIPRGYRVKVSGEMGLFQESFENLKWGFLLATFLVYLVLMAQFRSVRDPLVILVAVPLGLIGVILMLWATKTNVNIQSLLGTIFMVGIVVSNSILIVEFIKRRREEGMLLQDAIIDGSATRLRPVLMTSVAAIVGLLPMAIGMGEGAEVNIPLARAVIGGLLMSTILSLWIVPCLYRVFHGGRTHHGATGTLALFFLVTVGMPVLGYSQPLPLITLDDAMATAVRLYPKLAADRSRIAAARANVRVVEADYYPKIQAGVADSSGVSGSYAGLGFRGIVGSPFKKGAGVDTELETVLYDFGRTSARVDSSKARLRESQNQAEVSKLELQRLVAESYFICLQGRALGALFMKAERELRSFSMEVSRYVATGQRSEIDSYLVRAKLFELTEKVAQARHGEELATSSLNSLITEHGEITYGCADLEPRAINSNMTIEELTAQSFAIRPDLMKLDASIARATADEKLAKANFWPEITGVASVGVLEDTTVIDDDRYAVAIGLRIPVFDGNKREATLIQVQNELVALHQEHLALERQIRGEIRDKIIALRSARKLLDISNERRRTLIKGLEIAKDRYLNKSGPLAEWEQIFRSWLDGEVDYEARQADIPALEVSLKLAVGAYNLPDNKVESRQIDSVQ